MSFSNVLTFFITILLSHTLTWAIWPMWKLSPSRRTFTLPSSSKNNNKWDGFFDRQPRKYIPLLPSSRVLCNSHVTITSPEDGVSQLTSLIENLQLYGIHRDTIEQIVDKVLQEAQERHQYRGALSSSSYDGNKPSRFPFTSSRLVTTRHHPEVNFQQFATDVASAQRSHVNPESIIDKISDISGFMDRARAQGIVQRGYSYGLPSHSYNPEDSIARGTYMMMKLREDSQDDSHSPKSPTSGSYRGNSRSKIGLGSLLRTDTKPEIVHEEKSEKKQKPIEKAEDMLSSLVKAMKEVEANNDMYGDGEGDGDVEHAVDDSHKQTDALEMSMSRHLEPPLEPIRDVSVKVTVPGNGVSRQTVALSPGLSVYKAIYQAALSYDYDDGEGNPFDMSIEPDLQRKCYIVTNVSGQKSNGDGHWWVLVLDSIGQTVYEGLCLVPSSKLPLRPGYTIRLQYGHGTN